jgi:hypothetical protein
MRFVTLPTWAVSDVTSLVAHCWDIFRLVIILVGRYPVLSLYLLGQYQVCHVASWDYIMFVILLTGIESGLSHYVQGLYHACHITCWDGIRSVTLLAGTVSGCTGKAVLFSVTIALVL